MNEDMVIEKCNIYNMHKIKKIYLESFSKENRFSFLNLMYNVLFKNAEVYMVVENRRVVAFLYAILFNNERFILYLAVKEYYRNRKIGSYLLSWFLDKNKEHYVYLNIDEVNPKFNDYFIRNKRLKFYEKNGFYLTNYLSCSNNSKGNILSSKEIFDVKEYKKLDRKISKCFFCKPDEVVVKES